MKRALVVLVGMTILTVCAVPAFAGGIDTTDQITLSSAPGSVFTFKGTGGGNFSLNFTGATGKVSGQGTLHGATGGFYTIKQNGAKLTSAGVGCGGTCVLLNQSGPSILFSLGSAKGGSNLLTGFLSLVDVGVSGKTGTTNNDLVVNLTITGGSLASDFGVGKDGVVQLTLILGKGNLFGLLLNQKLLASLHSGTINPLLPEPSSLALLGASLISLGGILRWRKLPGC